MCTAHLLTVSYNIPGGSTPSPCAGTPLDADPPYWSCDQWCMLGSQSPLWTEWQTDKCKILPCPKLRLRVINMYNNDKATVHNTQCAQSHWFYVTQNKFWPSQSALGDGSNWNNFEPCWRWKKTLRVKPPGIGCEGWKIPHAAWNQSQNQAVTLRGKCVTTTPPSLCAVTTIQH